MPELPVSRAASPRGSLAPVDLLTTGQAARLCAVDPRTIARWVDAGWIPSQRTVGGRRRILRHDLLAFMRGRGMPTPSDAAPRPPRIAIVDDDPLVRRALARAVARLTPVAECEIAGDGFSAGALIARFRPDLVFLDIVMPGLSGVEVCKHIRAMPELAETAIVIVSGHVTARLSAELCAVGVDRILDKPPTAKDIKNALVELLARVRGAELQGRAAAGRGG